MKVRKEVKAGIITLVTLIAFWWLFQFLKGKNLFSNEDVYYIKFDKVEGLSPSRNVYIKGLKVGVVESIDPIPIKNNSVNFVVKIKISEKYKFSENTVAQIFSSGLMGSTEVNLILAEDSAPIAKSEDTLKGSIMLGIMDLVGDKLTPLGTNANVVLVKLDSTLTAVNKILDDKNRQNIELALIQLNDAMKEFTTLGKNANSLVNTNSTKVSSVLDNANQVLATANTSLGKYGTIADKLNNVEFNEIIVKLESSISNLNSITTKMNSGDGSMALLLNDPKLYNNLTLASENLSVLLGDLKTNPKNYLQFSVFGKKDKSINKQKN